MSRGRAGQALRMLPVAAGAWASAAVATFVPEAAAAVAVAGGALAVAGIAAMLRHPSRPFAIAVVAVAAAVAVAAQVAVAAPARAEVAALVDGSGRSVRVDAQVTGRVDPGPQGDIWLDAVATRVEVGAVSLTVPVPVRIGIPASHVHALHGADLGAVLAVRGAAIRPDPGDRAVVVVRVEAEPAIVSRPDGLLALMADLRAALVASAAGLPGPGAALVPGLAVGDTSAVDAQLDAAMKASSLSHLTAVSGANCAIVVGLAFGLAAGCGAPRGVRVGAGLGALGLFVLLVTPEPSVVRAGAMAAIAMLALALGRAGAGLAALCLAVCLLLVIDPWLSSSLGFALSSVATLALLALARPLADGLGRWMPRPLALAIAVPLAAQLACAPLLVLVDPRVPLLGVLANLLAAPAAAPATIAGFAACLAVPVPWVQDGLVGIAWLPASWIAGVAQAVAAVPGQHLPWLEGWPGAGALAIVGVAIGAAVATPPSRGRWRRQARVCAVGAVALLVGLIGGTTALRTVVGLWTVPASWQIAMCDIGQGDATLVRSADAVALIDTGPDPTLLGTCLDRFGVTRVDLLVLTHFDLDHVGGVEAVVGRVGTVLHGPERAGSAALARLSAGGARSTQVATGATGSLGAASWRVLWPAAAVSTAGNDASVVLEVSGGGLPRIALLGDLSAEPQARVRAAAHDVDVVKVAHHGSADQDPTLYDRLRAEVGVISVGADNDYGHPRASLLAMLVTRGTVVARTDRDGAVALWRDGDGLRLWREHGVGPAG